MHTWLAWVWLGLTLITTAAAWWWHDQPWLLAWITFMSGYALTATHWSAREGAAPSAEAGES
jgi:hypothetical protein